MLRSAGTLLSSFGVFDDMEEEVVAVEANGGEIRCGIISLGCGHARPQTSN